VKKEETVVREAGNSSFTNARDMKSIVTIGGGTGQYTLLSGLKKYPLSLTAIVSMADDGGSTGALRDELGVLPPGDIRQCLVALSDAESLVRELFNYRFDSGSLKGHNFGNIFLSALEKITGDFEDAVRVSGMVLATSGTVVPVTTQNARLICRDGSEVAIRGQYAIETSRIPDNHDLALDPEVFANPKAVRAIERADCVIIGPGAVFTSILPNLIVKGIPEAISRTDAKVVFNCNLMNKPGHTDAFSVEDHVELVERYIGSGRIDFVTYNTSMPDDNLLERYARDGEHPVTTGALSSIRAEMLGTDLLSRKMPALRKGDPIRRTLLRHDSEMLAALIVNNCVGGL